MALTLLGAPEPGDDESYRVWSALRDLVQEAVPVGARTRVHPFEPSFRLRSQAAWQPEVQLVAEILHPHGTFEPKDGDDRRLVAVVERRLTARGLVPASESHP